MAIGSIPGLSFIQNEFAVFIFIYYTNLYRQNRKLWPIFPAVTKFCILFSSSETRLIDELMVCTGICGSLLSCEAHSIFHL